VKLAIKKRATAWVVVLCILLLLSCSRDYPIFEPKGGRFPLDVGNWWKLSRESRWVFRPGIAPYGDSMVLRGSIYWEITEKSVLSGYESYVLRNEFSEEGGSTFVALEWYTDSWNGWDGLFHIAYAGFSALPPKVLPGYRFMSGGREFGSIYELSLWICGMELSQADTVLRIPPRKVLVYPLVVGKEWVAFDDVWLQMREVVDVENLTTPAGGFTCWKVRVSGEMLDLYDMIWFDWYADRGLVKRYFWDEDFIIDPFGNPIGTYEYTSVTILEDYRVH